VIRFTLTCERGHEFEAWFASGKTYEDRAKTHAVVCASCGSTVVQKAPMAPAVKRRREAPKSRETSERKKTYAFLKGLRDHLQANAENVGPAFPEEARKIHYGETEARSIYGEASFEEARELRDEGIPALPLPPLPEDHN